MGRLLDWLFLHLDVMTYSEFQRYNKDMLVFCESLTHNTEMQLQFNQLVAEKIGLNYAVGGVPVFKPLDKGDVAFG